MSRDEQVVITEADLTRPALEDLPSSRLVIRTDSEWNISTRQQISALGGIFQSADQAERYVSGLRTQLSSRLGESERRVQEVENALRTLKTGSKFDSSTSITIRGGDVGWIEDNPDYYNEYGALERVTDEGVFRLADTGHFSSIRSLGGFAGRVVIEKSLGELAQQGFLEDIADGSRQSFWMGTMYTPAPVKAELADVPWLSNEYRHGSAFMVTYYMDRPTLASEVFIDPVSTEPFDLVAVMWTPLTIKNAFGSGGLFESSAGWTFNHKATRITTEGIDNTGCLLCQNASGWASYTFDIRTLLAPVVSGTNQVATGAVYTGTRAQLTYNVRGLGVGDLRAGARIVWFDASGRVIDYVSREDFPPGFYAGKRLVDVVPLNAASGRIDLGIFSTIADSASAFFDSVEFLLGEQRWDCNVRIDRPTTVTLRNVALSSRYSFIFAQRNPRRESLSAEEVTEDFLPVRGILDLDPSLQKSTQVMREQLRSRGAGQQVFAYRIGLKELDLRYREHVPRGSLVSLPIRTDREIRRIWVTAELGKHHNVGVKFVVYPFSSDLNTTSEIQPYRSGELEASESSGSSEGQVLNIYTTDELVEGWYNPADKYFVIRPKQRLETFNGTDRDGKLRLRYALHFRAPKVHSKHIDRGIQVWLDRFSIFPSIYDPNAATLFGATETASGTVAAIRERKATIPGLSLTQLKTAPGYIPLKVTVKTSRWTAHPDTLGRPDQNKVRSVTGEKLVETTLVETVQETTEEIMSFEAWLNSIDVEKFKQQYRDAARALHQALRHSNSSQSMRVFYESLQSPRLKQNLKNVYEALRAQNKIPKLVGSKTVRTAAVERDDAYKTKYAPLINGPSGTSIRLYAHDPSLQKYLPLSQNDFAVDPNQGLVRILTALASGFTEVYASYQYIGYSNTEDFFSSAIGFLTQGASGIADIAGAIGLKTRTLPITRNMTDYITGKVPELRPPNFDRLSRDYYPVIEYYVTSQGEVVFSRDFFQYGDIPADITVEYETLAIEPRVAVLIDRSGSPSATPQLRSVSMHVREGSSAPTREVT